MEETSEHGVLGRYQSCSEERILDRTQSSFTKHSQLIAFRKLLGWKLEKSNNEKNLRHFVLLQKLP